MTSKYGCIVKLETYHVVLLTWNIMSWPLVPEIIITLEDITRENGPLVNPPISLS
jgi:hypothetical protein